MNFNSGSHEYLRIEALDLQSRTLLNHDDYFTKNFDSAIDTDDEPPNLLDPVSIYLEPRVHSRKLYQTLSPLLLIFLFFPLMWRDKKLMILSSSVLLVYVAIGRQTYLLRYVLLVIPLMAVVAGVVVFFPG